MSVRLLALDIDGTLIAPGSGHLGLPTPAICEAIAALQRAGVTVVLASGRMFPGTQKIARHLDLLSPVISQQGATIHSVDGTVLHRYAIDADIAADLAAFSQEEGWPFAWFDAVRYLVSSPNEASREYGLVSGIEPEYHDNPHLTDVIPTGIDIISSNEHANAIHRHLEHRYGDRVHLLDFPSVTAAHSPSASKGNALKLLAADLGIEQAQVVAIGDSVNDVSMLRWAGRGVTLPHCDHYARAAADEILSGQGIDGMAPFLRHLLREVGG